MFADDQDFVPVPEVHSHQCWSCKHIWQHARTLGRTREEHEKAHTCEKCGDHQYLVHEFIDP